MILSKLLEIHLLEIVQYLGVKSEVPEVSAESSEDKKKKSRKMRDVKGEKHKKNRNEKWHILMVERTRTIKEFDSMRIFQEVGMQESVTTYINDINGKGHSSHIFMVKNVPHIYLW